MVVLGWMYSIDVFMWVLNVGGNRTDWKKQTANKTKNSNRLDGHSSRSVVFFGGGGKHHRCKRAV